MAGRSPTRSPSRSQAKSTRSWKDWPDEAKLQLLARLKAEDWHRKARPSQRAPAGEWRIWYVSGGRGSGKTRTGAETFAQWILVNPPGEWAIVAPTYADARDTCVEGPESGLLAVLGSGVGAWNRSLGELRVANGSRIHIDGADDGALRIQGKNLRGAWCDEVGLWRQWERAWNESLAFAVRKDPALIIATGTPKGRQGIPQLLIEDDEVPVTRLLMRDNRDNLSASMVDALERAYAGTRLGRQELEGEMLDDVEGALWSWKMIEDGRVAEAPELRRVVVAIDPAVSATERSDETGIIVAGIDDAGEGYVLRDRSGIYSPNGWASQAISAFEAHRADRIVAERNNGGDMIEHTIHTIDPKVPYKSVWASKGKRTQAEPVAALYEQGRIHHVGAFPELESQLVNWTPEERDSPDRLDALVWAFTELMLGRRAIPDAGPVSVTGTSAWRG